MQQILEMTVSPVYTGRAAQRLRLLKLLRTSLMVCLALSWIYGIAVMVAFLEKTDGSATNWMLFFAMFTLPATALLIMLWLALRRFSREYDYTLREELLEIHVSHGGDHRKLLVQINCRSIVAFGPVSQAESHDGRTVRAVVGTGEAWALDVRHEGQTVRVLLQPNEVFCTRLKAYAQQGGTHNNLN